LLRVLERYGSAQALAGDPTAAERVSGWGGKYLEAKKVQRFVQEARFTNGVRPGPWEVRQIQEYARQALQARRQGQAAEKRLRQLGHGHVVLEAQAQAVGLPTACVLWVGSGDPRNFDSAAAYRKAMGLNLVERSSGTYQGQLHLSKRGNARSRQWLYFAALRLVQRCGVRSWYEAKKAQDASQAKRILVALMRKLVLALYQVGVQGQKFDEARLVARMVRGQHGLQKMATKDG
jgi:transposase